MNEQQLSKLEVIKKEKNILLGDISIAQERLAELNCQRQNIIMR